MKKGFVILIACMLSLPLRGVFAHGSLITIDQTVGNYIVEFENNSFGDVYAQDFVTYDFRLLDKNTRQDLPYDSVYTRFQNDKVGQQVSAFLLPTDNPGPAYLGTVIAKEGDYNVHVDFTKSGQQLVRADFSLKVLPPLDPITVLNKPDLQSRKTVAEKYVWVITLILGLGLGIYIGASEGARKLFKKLRNKKG